MKYCQKCGAELIENGTVCPNCGPVMSSAAAPRVEKKKFGMVLGRNAVWFWAAVLLAVVNPFLMLLDWFGESASVFGMEVYSRSYTICDMFQELGAGFLTVLWVVLLLVSIGVMLIPLFRTGETYPVKCLIPMAISSLLIFLLTCLFCLVILAAINESGTGMAELKAGGYILPLESLLLAIVSFSLIHRIKRQQRGY